PPRRPERRSRVRLPARRRGYRAPFTPGSLTPQRKSMSASKGSDLTLAAADVIVERAEKRYQSHRREIYVTTDRTFAGLMIGQWLFGVLLALLVSPYAWQGKVRT